MNEKLVNFVVKFRKPNDSNPSDTQQVVSSFFNKCRVSLCGPSVQVGNVELVNQDLVYSGDLYKVPVTLVYNGTESSKICDIKEKVCSKWCRAQKAGFKQQWLVLENDKYFRTKNPFHLDIETKEFAFGTLPDMCCFMQHYHYEGEGGELLTSFYHNRKFFELFVSHMDCSEENTAVHKFVVKYESINRIIVNDVPGADFTEMFLHLCYPPLVSRDQLDNSDIEEDNFSTCSDETYKNIKWQRTLTFGCRCKRSRCSVKKIGGTPVMMLKFSGKLRVRDIIDRLRYRCPSTTEFCYGSIRKEILHHRVLQNEYKAVIFSQPLPDSFQNEVERFSCDYAWKMMYCRSLEIQDQVLLLHQLQSSIVVKDHWSFVKADLMKFVGINAKALSEAFCHISEMIQRCVVFTFTSALKQIFEYYCNSEKKHDLPKGMCLVRRVIITPARLVYLPEMESFDNRVIREFKNSSEYMLRVSIQDDDFRKLTYAIQYHPMKDVIMKKVVADVLLEGIVIGSRRYEFLASSSSQLRDHGLWMYAKDYMGNTAQEIRWWMGDFRHIRNVAKYMARMGQCFSTSDEAVQVTVPRNEETHTEDIKTRDGRYTFSDGIGKISTGLAEKIRKAKEEHQTNSYHSEGEEATYKPIAFQIRYKGCKGMVVEDPNLRDFSIAIRPSMEKFKCNSSNKIEIVKVSAPRILYLNRPLITILEQLGVRPDTFMDMQKEMILDLTDCLLYEDRAAEMLKSQLSWKIPFKSLYESGLSLTEEPFFRSLLLSLYRNAVDKLKTKARIAVPYQFGRNMLGVLDETKTLKYGEVFVQYSEKIGFNVSPTHILEGTVVVTKNPCMHPGDVRKLKAVDVPALHHIKDCVVFPAQGPRPHPDEMAGSDLDGDEYVVIWMKELIFPVENSEPMLYPANQERVCENEIGVKEMVEFFCEYIQNDNIGTLAYAHLAWADALKDGIFSDVCMSIAAKYPFVLDFAKTGFTERLSRDEKPSSYPDFMEKGFVSDSYRSKRTLGLLYRFVKNLEACIDKADVGDYQNVEDDKLLLYPGWERYLESASKHRDEYVAKVHSLLLKYGIRSEAEALTGHVNGFKVDIRGRQETSDTAIIVKSYLMGLMSKYRYIFVNEVDAECGNTRLSTEGKKKRKFQRASAWYAAVYKNCASCQGVLSMPWILSDVLAEVRAAHQQYTSELVHSSLIGSLNYSLKRIYSCAVGNCDTDCPCVTLAENVVSQWMVTSKLSLSMVTSQTACQHCFARIFDYFVANSGMRCCSWSDDFCMCDFDCSPAKLIMEFLKFYLSKVTALGTCHDDCKGFRHFNLQSTALKTYASVAVTRSAKPLGITLDNEFLTDCENCETISEGDPIRVGLFGRLHDLICNHLDEVKDVLKAETGVRNVEITIQTGKKGNHMLISATGTGWQRWDLEELVMDAALTDMLEKRLLSLNHR